MYILVNKSGTAKSVKRLPKNATLVNEQYQIYETGSLSASAVPFTVTLEKDGQIVVRNLLVFKGVLFPEDLTLVTNFGAVENLMKTSYRVINGKRSTGSKKRREAPEKEDEDSVSDSESLQEDDGDGNSSSDQCSDDEEDEMSDDGSSNEESEGDIDDLSDADEDEDEEEEEEEEEDEDEDDEDEEDDESGDDLSDYGLDESDGSDGYYE